MDRIQSKLKVEPDWSNLLKLHFGAILSCLLIKVCSSLFSLFIFNFPPCIQIIEHLDSFCLSVHFSSFSFCCTLLKPHFGLLDVDSNSDTDLIEMAHGIFCFWISRWPFSPIDTHRQPTAVSRLPHQAGTIQTRPVQHPQGLAQRLWSTSECLKRRRLGIRIIQHSYAAPSRYCAGGMSSFRVEFKRVCFNKFDIGQFSKQGNEVFLRLFHQGHHRNPKH